MPADTTLPMWKKSGSAGAISLIWPRMTSRLCKAAVWTTSASATTWVPPLAVRPEGWLIIRIFRLRIGGGLSTPRGCGMYWTNTMNATSCPCLLWRMASAMRTVWRMDRFTMKTALRTWKATLNRWWRQWIRMAWIWWATRCGAALTLCPLPLAKWESGMALST